MLRFFFAAVLLPGCCTEAGCGGQLTILLDRPLAEGAVVTLEHGGTVHDCSGAVDTGSRECDVTEVGGRPAIVLTTGMGAEPTDALTLEVVEGDQTVTRTVEPEWDTFYPNGKRCGGACIGAEVEVTL